MGCSHTKQVKVHVISGWRRSTEELAKRDSRNHGRTHDGSDSGTGAEVGEGHEGAGPRSQDR